MVGEENNLSSKGIITKEKVVETLNTDLNKLIKHYEDEISVLQRQNSILQKELSDMKVQLEKVNKKNIDMLTKVLNRGSNRSTREASKTATSKTIPAPKKIEKKDEYDKVVLRSITYVKKLPKGGLVDPYTKEPLSREVIELAVYNNANFTGQYEYIRVKVLSNKGTGVAYVRGGEINQINSKVGQNKYVDIREFGKGKRFTSKDIHDHNFRWPSTDLSENEYTNENQEFNEKSKLRKIGYQITGMSKVKRWEILDKAVPILGLKYIAYTIANHVKLRKGQANGEVKFSHSITEWEKDLVMLKEKYYRGNFNWPST